MKRYFILLSLLSISIFLSACNNDEAETNSDVIHVYTTIYPLKDFTEKIGGELVHVESVFPPGGDAHTFEPTPKTIVKIAEADLFIYTGAGVEGFVEATTETLKDEQVKIVEAGKGIELMESGHNHEHEEGELHESENEHDDEHIDPDEHSEHEEHVEVNDEHNHGDTDPHIWLDPIRAIEIARNIKNELSAQSPDHTQIFEDNFEQLKTDLEKLDEDFHEVIEHAPTKKVLVAHAAYGYWESAYGLEQISVTGLSPTDEPSQKQLKDTIKVAKEHHIPYVIFDQNLTNKIAEVVQREIGAEALTLHNLETIDEEDQQNNEDYFSLMRKNLATLQQALNN